MLNQLRDLIPERSPLRLLYHKAMAIFAAVWWRFPGYRLKIIGVTGTSGKSTTVELIHYLLENSGVKSGAISGIQIQVGDQKYQNASLRTTLRPWETQKWLRKMVSAGCEFAIIEVSSHAIDQHRLWGVPFDTALLTNLYDNEHLDYHEDFADYVRTKSKLFKSLNYSYRKPAVPKVTILNKDDDNFEIFKELSADRQWSYSISRPADVGAQDLILDGNGSQMGVKLPNHHLDIKTPIIGRHNIQNLLAAITAVAANGVAVDKIEKLLEEFPGIPGRLEPVNEGQDFSVVVDFSYKPSGLEAVLETMNNIVDGRLLVVWGAVGNREARHRTESAKVLDVKADELILTTDDPYMEDPKQIANHVKEGLSRGEGDRFWEIEDRYEAIRYAVYAAQPGDCVLIAGRGHETVQTIGTKKIDFDDRVVVREILQFAQKKSLLD